MKRYILGTYNEPDAENYLARTVFEPTPIRRHTGILDKDGNPIFVEEKMDQIGFVRDDRP